MGTIRIGAHEYPRVQFYSIEDYFNGIKPTLPPMIDLLKKEKTNKLNIDYV